MSSQKQTPTLYQLPVHVCQGSDVIGHFVNVLRFHSVDLGIMEQLRREAASLSVVRLAR